MATILIYITLNRMIYESNQQQQKHETRQLEGNPSFCLLVKKKKNNIIDCQCWLQCLAMWKFQLWMVEHASSRLAIMNRHDSRIVNCRLARLGIG